MNILNYFKLKVAHKEKKVPKLDAEKAQKVLRGSKLVKSRDVKTFTII